MMIIIIIMGLEYKNRTVTKESGKAEGEMRGYLEEKGIEIPYICIITCI
jgi:hypothetical protein